MKTLITIFIAATVFILGGCSDYLNEPLKGTYSTSSFYQTSDQALLALTGVYSAINFSTANNAIWVFGDVASDDAIKGGATTNLPDAGTIDNFSYIRTNTYLQNMWQFYYEVISRANFLLYYIPNISMDPSLKARVTGEAKFLRAYAYFNLVNIYGEVPLRLQPPLSQSLLNVPKSPVADVYTQIKKDLTDAATGLSAFYTGADVGRATKGAAYGLLAKAHLYLGEWSDALVAVDSLDKFHSYTLVIPYQNNFIDSTQNNSESVFEVESLENQSPSLGSVLDQFFSPIDYNGYFVDDPLQNFVSEFESTADGTPDPRLDNTVGRVGHPWGQR